MKGDNSKKERTTLWHHWLTVSKKLQKAQSSHYKRWEGGRGSFEILPKKNVEATLWWVPPKTPPFLISSLKALIGKLIENFIFLLLFQRMFLFLLTVCLYFMGASTNTANKQTCRVEWQESCTSQPVQYCSKV